MSQVQALPLSEPVRIDPDRLVELCMSLGDAATEHLLVSSIEELGQRICSFNALVREGSRDEITTQAVILRKLAKHIGMTTLERCLCDAIFCIEQEDMTGFAAVTARINRIADHSLCAIWDLQDMYI